MDKRGHHRPTGDDRLRATPSSQKRSLDMSEGSSSGTGNPERFIPQSSQHTQSFAPQMSSTAEKPRDAKSESRLESRQKQQGRHRQQQREQEDYQGRLLSSSSTLKVAIPRLPRDNETSLVAGSGRDAGEKARVSHACEPCRARKTKCSGERPTCAHCIEYKLTCVYADGKRDRVKRFVLERLRGLICYLGTDDPTGRWATFRTGSTTSNSC